MYHRKAAMHKTLEVLILRRRSEAGNVEALQQAVRSVLADAGIPLPGFYPCHSPAASVPALVSP